MDYPPTLLESATSDWTDFGWDVIDRETWGRLSTLMALPAEARIDLLNVVWRGRADKRDYDRRRRIGSPPEQLSRSRAQLKRLHKLADDLVHGLEELPPGAASAVRIAMNGEQAFEHMPILLPFGEVDTRDLEVRAVERWRDRLSCAVEIAKDWRGVPGEDRWLRLFVGNLDHLLVEHTGKGLVRRAVAAKTRSIPRGRSEACREFITVMAGMVAEKIAIATLDDAIKDVVQRRRKMGKL